MDLNKERAFIFDVDDVILNLKEALNPIVNDATGKNIHHSEWHTHHITHVYGNITNDEVNQLILDNNLLIYGNINENVLNAMNQTQKMGYKNIILTARGWIENGKEITEQFLNDNLLPFHETHLVDLSESKADVIKKLQEKYEIHGFIDDSHKHISECAERDDINIKNLYLRDQPWNKEYNHKKVKRVGCISEIMLELDVNLSNERNKSFVQNNRC